MENEEDDTSTGDVGYMDLDPEYVSGSDSDLNDNPLQNDEIVFFITLTQNRSGR